MTDPSWCSMDVIQFNYVMARWNMFPRQEDRISFFWKKVLGCLPALRGCVIQGGTLGVGDFILEELLD